MGIPVPECGAYSAGQVSLSFCIRIFHSSLLPVLYVRVHNLVPSLVTSYQASSFPKSSSSYPFSPLQINEQISAPNNAGMLAVLRKAGQSYIDKIDWIEIMGVFLCKCQIKYGVRIVTYHHYNTHPLRFLYSIKTCKYYLAQYFAFQADMAS